MFKKMRFTLICILTVVMAMSFIGCSGGSSDGNNNTGTGKANPVPEDLAGNLVISAYNAEYSAKDPYGIDENNDNDNDVFMFTQA